MKITIKGQDIELHYNFKALMLYENIIGSSFVGGNFTNIITLLYSCVIASNPNINITLDELVAWLDDNRQVFKDFSKWVESEATKMNAALKEDDGKTEKKRSKK